MKTQNIFRSGLRPGNVTVGGLLAAVLCLLAAPARAQVAVQEWVQRYNGSGNGEDDTSAVAVDSHGDVIVTGSSWGIGSSFDYLTIKYSSAGVPLWTNRYNGRGNGNDYANAVAVDAFDNVIVTGEASGSGSGFDYVTIKYSSAGVPLWTNRYNGSANQDDRAYALAVDAQGAAYVTGASIASSGGFDFATVAYSSAGVALWTNRYNGSANKDDRPVAVAVDDQGHVYVTGQSLGAAGGWNYVTIGYSTAGMPLWTNIYNGSAGQADYPFALAADPHGNVYVTGESVGSLGGFNYATIAYSSAGVPLWLNLYNGSASGDDVAYAVAVDPSGNVVVTGGSAGSHSASDFATIKYSGAGIPLWTNRYNGAANGDDTAYAVAVDTNGNVYVAGNSVGSTTGYDYATVAYSSAGVPLWTNRYNAPANGNDEVSAIAVDGTGNVFVTGRSWSGTSYDYATVKYSITRPIPLAIQQVDNQLVLSWTGASFRLQSAPAVTGPFTNLPGATSPWTIPITGGQQYFRLISN